MVLSIAAINFNKNVYTNRIKIINHINLKYSISWYDVNSRNRNSYEKNIKYCFFIFSFLLIIHISTHVWLFWCVQIITKNLVMIVLLIQKIASISLNVLVKKVCAYLCGGFTMSKKETVNVTIWYSVGTITVHLSYETSANLKLL